MRYLVVAMAAAAFAAPAVEAAARDYATPQAAAEGFAAAWNAHDMDAFADLFWEDATFVNRGGRVSAGRATIKAHHAAIHATHLRNSRLDNRIESLRPVGANAAVAMVRSDLSGSERAPQEVVRTRLMLVLERRGAVWRIGAAQNTTLAADAN